MLGFGHFSKLLSQWYDHSRAFQYYIVAMRYVLKQVKPHIHTSFPLNHPNNGEPEIRYVPVPVELFNEIERLTQEAFCTFNHIAQEHYESQN